MHTNCFVINSFNEVRYLETQINHCCFIYFLPGWIIHCICSILTENQFKTKIMKLQNELEVRFKTLLVYIVLFGGFSK